MICLIFPRDAALREVTTCGVDTSAVNVLFVLIRKRLRPMPLLKMCLHDHNDLKNNKQ